MGIPGFCDIADEKSGFAIVWPRNVLKLFAGAGAVGDLNPPVIWADADPPNTRNMVVASRNPQARTLHLPRFENRAI
jgi:hypothetical protein